jgi:hypothetical protein
MYVSQLDKSEQLINTKRCAMFSASQEDTHHLSKRNYLCCVESNL